MQKTSSSKCLPKISTIILAIALVTFIVFISTVSNPSSKTNSISYNPHFQHQISHLQTQLGILLQQLHTESSHSKELSNFSDQVLRIATSVDRLADSHSTFYANSSKDKDNTSHIDVDLTEPEESEEEAEEGSFNGNAFKSPEFRNYTLPKPNRLENGKKNFLDLEAINPSVGLGCTRMAAYLDRYMTYKVNGMCPDDWDLAQKLLVGGCDPLPRIRCFARTPCHDSKPAPQNSPLWTQPSNAEIIWNRYKCKNYDCLVSKETVNIRGFYKCSGCFDLTKKGWEIQINSSVSAELTIDEVLGLVSRKIRVGLDFSPTTGTFAALMRERNVTIASATLNLGAPFNEVIALRGLLPLYISLGSRLPFFDNTLDIVHSTLFLDGWISLELLEYVVFDWDRVLRPFGILWVDRFFCKKDEMKLYLDVFEKVGYKKLLWRVVPKKDKLADEVFFSAVLEKPVRA